MKPLKIRPSGAHGKNKPNDRTRLKHESLPHVEQRRSAELARFSVTLAEPRALVQRDRRRQKRSRAQIEAPEAALVRVPFHLLEQQSTDSPPPHLRHDGHTADIKRLSPRYRGHRSDQGAVQQRNPGRALAEPARDLFGRGRGRGERGASVEGLVLGEGGPQH